MAVKKARNTIASLTCEDGRKIHSEEGIMSEISGFYEKLLGTVHNGCSGEDVNSLMQLLPHKLNIERKTFLDSEVSREEITKVINSMPKNRSPGPEGYTLDTPLNFS